MCDSLDLSSLASADDAAVVDAISESARAENRAAAARLAAIGELMNRRLFSDGEDDERDLWACDGWDSVAAEVAAALGLTHRRASTQMHLAHALRTRIPKTAAGLANGELSLRSATTIAWRTKLVEDPAILATIDAELADKATGFGTLSDKALDNAIDAVLAEHDPDAVIEHRDADRNRDVQFGKRDDTTGTTSMYGSLTNVDAALFDRRLRAMATSVCPEDPRTTGQRRSDAVALLITGADRLPCRCGNTECPATTAPDTRADHIVVHVVADQAAVEQARATNAAAKAEAQARRTAKTVEGVARADDSPGNKPVEPPAPKDPSPQPNTCARTAVLQGGGVVPAPLLAELVDTGATVKALRTPAEAPEPRYRPSTTLATWVHARDMTCRFPGCNTPSERCDLDHTIPDGQGGPTHPSNLACLCRKHHLLKTFWTEWSETQHPDGTIVWTTPAGKTYTTHPGSKIAFPNWDTTTATLPTPTRPSEPANPHRGLQMPRRRRTRKADQAQRLKTERGNNAPARQRYSPPAKQAEQNPHTREGPDDAGDPPPF
ncbi:hypothetical protein MCHIJ_35270 [Mycolicibacterium chitae]|uniref:Protein of uncharacterized function DUF222 n=1 Tax=Mycolicibacterium chitae TaxID=1792 RepID=A0A448I5F5_MYCCI|nr:HNH endonuclease signature motif containing protein [Mycolicibacterium chitae]BBZ04090.1 hypothetical protein MCHIJ_35270 [Mycolicibacterium chitae]VEG47741.1 protein of uncharacterised function DUF222 [Mycolicibacterium chitae]